MNRRKFLQVSGLTSAGALISLDSHGAITPKKQRDGEAPDTKLTSFVHPGILQTRSDLDAMKQMVEQGQEPVASAWKRLLALPTASLNFEPSPVAHVFRSGDGVSRLGADEFSASGQAAHSHALRWYVSRDPKHAEKVIEILDAWANTLWDFSGNDAKLLAGWSGGYFCEAAEILRATYPPWTGESRTTFQRMLTGVLVPLLYNFFPEANGNWDGAIMFTLGAIAVYLENQALFNRVTHHYLYGPTNAGILKYVWPTGQCEESTRDQAHVQLGLGYFSYAALVAWNQGVDLFGAGNHRLALGFEYTSKFMLDEDVPYFGVISPRARGNFLDFYEAAYQHYTFDKNIMMPYTTRAAQRARNETSISAAWLFRGTSSRQARATAPTPGMHAADAGAQDGVDLQVASSWHRVMPGSSLQAAVDAMSDGGVVLLEAGVHTLPSPLLLKSGVTIMGHGRQSILHLVADGADYCLMQSRPSLQRVTLRSFVVEGAQTTDWPKDPNQPRRERTFQTAKQRGGILLNGDKEGDIREVVLDHVTVRNCTMNGISISGASGVTLTNCDLTDNGGNNAPGHFLNHNLLLNHVTDCTVTGNRLVFSMGGSGLSAQNSTQLSVQHNEASRNCQFGMEFLNCAAVTLQDTLLEANDEGGFRATTDGQPYVLKTKGLIQRLNGS